MKNTPRCASTPRLTPAELARLFPDPLALFPGLLEVLAIGEVMGADLSPWQGVDLAELEADILAEGAVMPVAVAAALGDELFAIAADPAAWLDSIAPPSGRPRDRRRIARAVEALVRRHPPLRALAAFVAKP